MAPGRIHLGGLVALAAILAVVVSGCGGGSSSAPGTANSASSTAASTSRDATTTAGGGGGANAGESNAAAEADSSSTKKKHAPVELPEGPPEKGPTKAQRARVPIANIKVSVPGGLAVVNTCKGKNVSPEISWGTAPSDATELAIFGMNLQPVNGKLHFDWAMAGIDPSLEGLKEGDVPKGAILGRNSEGQNKYSLCPTSSKPEIYVFAVYAITKSLSPKPGFEPLAFRKEATRASEENGIVAVTYAAG